MRTSRSIRADHGPRCSRTTTPPPGRGRGPPGWGRRSRAPVRCGPAGRRGAGPARPARPRVPRRRRAPPARSRASGNGTTTCAPAASPCTCAPAAATASSTAARRRGQFPTQPAQVPGQVAVRGQRGEHPLPGPGRPGAGALAPLEHGGPHRRRRHQPAHAQGRGEQLARGAQVRHHVRAERGQQRQRGHVVAQLAVVVVLDHQEALGRGPGRPAPPGAPRTAGPRAGTGARACSTPRPARSAARPPPARTSSTGAGTTARPASRSAVTARW